MTAGNISYENNTSVLPSMTLMESTISWWNKEAILTTTVEERSEGTDAPPDEVGCFVYRMVMDGVLGIFISFGGLAGNSLTFLVFWKDRHSSATAYLLIVLAAVDSLVLLTWAPFRAARAIANYTEDRRFFFYAWVVIQHYGLSFTFTCHLMSTWCVVLVTCVRYIAVCHPERSQRWLAPNVVRKATAIVLSGCVVFIIPHVFDSYIVYDSARGQPKKVTAEWANSQLYDFIYPSVLYNLVLYVVPLSMIGFCTYKIVRSLAEARKRRQEMTTASRDEHEITFSLVIVVVVFIICQLTVPVDRIWASLPHANRGCPYASAYYTAIAVLGPILNSAVNFIIFVLCCKRFRNKVISIIWRKKQIAPISINSTVGTDENASTSRKTESTGPVGVNSSAAMRA